MAKTKTAKPQEEEVQDVKPNEQFRDFVAQQVLDSVGVPPDFSHVNAINTFDNRWRVNVYNKSPGFVEKRMIVASFYCITDSKGKIVTPTIEKQF